MIYNKRSPMVKEDKNLKKSFTIREDQLQLQRKNDWALKKGKAREEKYTIYPDLLDRELFRTIEALNNAMEMMRYYKSVYLLIKGYVDYLQEFGRNFDYLELRKYRNGVLTSLWECARVYQMVEDLSFGGR